MMGSGCLVTSMPKSHDEVIVEQKLPNLGKKRDLKVEIVQQDSKSSSIQIKKDYESC